MATRPDPTPSTDRGELLASLGEKLARLYVFPEHAGRMCQALRGLQDEAAFLRVEDGHALAATLTARLQAVHPDRHLRVRWFAERPPEVEEAPEAQRESRQRAAEMDRHGIHRAEISADEIGCLDIRQFHHPDCSGEIAAATMDVLASCRALIIDLRQCRGGEPAMVALLSSYLFDERPVHLNSLYIRPAKRTEEFWTSAQVTGRRFGKQGPAFVLTSRDTFSAGEEFAYNLQALGRATVVGEATRGGAHAGDIHWLNRHYAVFIPDSRAINPITGTNWEGCGVQPDVACPAEEAFAVAYPLALRRVAAPASMIPESGKMPDSPD